MSEDFAYDQMLRRTHATGVLLRFAWEHLRKGRFLSAWGLLCEALHYLRHAQGLWPESWPFWRRDLQEIERRYELPSQSLLRVQARTQVQAVQAEIERLLMNIEETTRWEKEGCS